MGAQTSRDAGATSAEEKGEMQDERSVARAWRVGVPFTLLHDESFVVEKYQELVAAGRSSLADGGRSKGVERAETTVSGMDEAPLDEMQHAADMARIKLFAQPRRGDDSDNSAAGTSSSGFRSTAQPNSSSTVTASASSERENSPSALAGMVGNTLSREAPESVADERLRVQRMELIQAYFEQIAARMKREQRLAVEETSTDASVAAAGSDSSAVASEAVARASLNHGRTLLLGVTPASVFSVGSFRMQLEMLREFRVLSPRLFENGTLAIVETLLDSPAFALRDVAPNSPEDVLLEDARRFCQSILKSEHEGQTLPNAQRQLMLLLLLALGVSSGRISLLLEFVDGLLCAPPESLVANDAEGMSLQGHPFTSWVDVFVQRMLSYRIDFALGTFEKSAYGKLICVKTLPREGENATEEVVEKEDASASLALASVATDGSFAYTWSLSKGLAKVGTGLNFTIAGRVYAEVPASQYSRILNDKRTLRKLVYGFGDGTKDVSDIARREMARRESEPESPKLTVRELFAASNELGMVAEPRLLVSFCVGEVQDVCVFEDGDKLELPLPRLDGEQLLAGAGLKVCRAWYGDLEVLSDVALSELRDQVGVVSTNGTEDSEVGVTYTQELLEQLITLSSIPLDKISDSKRMMVIFAGGDGIGAQLLNEGDRFTGVEDRSQDSYFSSLVFCGDSLYLNLVYPERDLSGMLTDGTIRARRSRQLIRIAPQDLGVLEVLPIEPTSSPGGTASPATACVTPLCTYLSEGRLIYEIDMGSDQVEVAVFATKASPAGGKRLNFIRSFALDLKSVQCTELLSCLVNIRGMKVSGGKLEFHVPSFYTNGTSIGMLLADASSSKDSSSKKRVHCVLFDCESGQPKASSDGEKSGSCLERFLPQTSACFDARNNLLWLFDASKGVLQSYQNTGKRISLNENNIPVDTIIGHVTGQIAEKTQPNFAEMTGLTLLAFMYKNADASDPSDAHVPVDDAGERNDGVATIPFAIDIEVATFQRLLGFTTKYVILFQANEASTLQAYLLQACLGLLNTNLERLLTSADGTQKQDAIALLRAGLASPLNTLLHLSSKENGGTEQEPQVQESPSSAVEADQRSRAQVASVALNLYTTSIHIFHADVSKQFAHILKYLELWQQGKATAMELKIMSRLLSHVCTRVDAIHQSMLASDETLHQFLKLIEFAIGVQQRELRRVCLDSSGDADGGAAAPRLPHHDDASSELISLVNAITQAIFGALAIANKSQAQRALDVALSVFGAVGDACASICSGLAEQVKQQGCQERWMQIEKVLKDGFVGILTPMILSCGVTFLRGTENVVTMLWANSRAKSELDKRGASSSEEDASSVTRSRFFQFLQENTSKMQKFMTALNVLVSMIDEAKREHTVENVSMVTKSETMESSHEYENNMDALEELQVPGASRMVIAFDPRTRTEVNYDYVTFYKDKSKSEYYGSQYYSGRDTEQNWPGVGENSPLIIESDHCYVYFHTDGSNTDWGYKFTATVEILERTKTLQQHWLVFLLENVVHLLDESIKLFVDGGLFAPIEDVEVLNERVLQSDLLKSGVCPEESKNAKVLQLLQDFVNPPESSDAESVINALLEQSSASLKGVGVSRSSSFKQITNSAPNKNVNSAVRAVAAAILHHNMWGMDAYAFAQRLRSDVSEELLRGWKNAQKMRDWFHLGDAADAGIHGQMMPSRRRPGRLRRQPSAYKGLSEESLAILCENVIERAKFLLEITPVSFVYVSGAKRRWGLLAKYGHALARQGSSDSPLDKWYNLLDELQAATELRSLFQYRRSSSERLKQGQVRSVTEQVLEFIQSDVDVAEMRKVIEVRNRRAASRALGLDIFLHSLENCPNLRLQGILLESFASTLKRVAFASAFTSLNGTTVSTTTLTSNSEAAFPRLHFDATLSGCDEVLRQRIVEAFGSCLTVFSQLLTPAAASDGALITGILKCCAIDYELEDSYLLEESRVLPQIIQLLSSESVRIRRAAQSVLGALLSRFVVGKASSNLEGDEDDAARSEEYDASAFQQQLFSAVGLQLEDVASTVKMALNASYGNGLGKSTPRYLPEHSPGLTAPCLQSTGVCWNHSIMLWVYASSKGSLYALKVGDEVRRGPNWDGSTEPDSSEMETGTVVGIPSSTKVHVRWNTSGLTSQCEFDPKRGIFEVILVDEGAGGTIFFKGNKNLTKDTAAAKPWSHFGLFLTDKRMLVYKIACGSDKECVFETDCELATDAWSHVAIVQDEDALKIFVNGSMASQHVLESFLVMDRNVNVAESAIIESAHPFEDSIDQYCPIHIPGAVKIRLTFDPLCDIDGSTGFVRFYKDAKCDEFWGDENYTGKYSDPERNFPGAQSSRTRSRQQSEGGVEGDAAGLDAVEIPCDKFLVYFHNEGSSNGWGFRILASPEFASPEGELTRPPSHLNPYPFYFGEAPGRVLDDSAADCWIYEPKVLGYPISESDLTAEIQASCPSTESAPIFVPAERILHILGLIRTCSERSFSRSLIGTPENIGNLMFLSFDDRVSVEIRSASMMVLKDLAGLMTPETMDVQFGRAFPNEKKRFLAFVFSRLADALNVWRKYAEEEQGAVPNSEEVNDEGSIPEEGLLELRASAQGEASMVAAYISLIRGAAEFFDWGESVFDLVASGLRPIQSWGNDGGKLPESAVGPALASFALLGGNYAGAYIGARVRCCVNVDGKETIETGYLVQFRLKNGVQTARVLFDCDLLNAVDVPVSDIAPLSDDEQGEFARFLTRMAPFAAQLKDLYAFVLRVDTQEPQTDESYQPKLVKKQIVEVLESEHPYAAGEDVTYPLTFRGANEIVVYFDKMSCTAGPNDYVQFRKRGGVSEPGRGDDKKYWGDEKYYGDSFPGMGATQPLHIPAECVDVYFYTEGSSNSISEWGFKLTAHAFEETVTYPPESPPSVMTSALNDIRARCIKSLGLMFRAHNDTDVLPAFASLLPSLAKIANAPSDGRPIQSSPKSQVFESKHPYANSVMEYMKVTFSGASTLTVTFDPQSRTEQGCDYLCFFKDKSLNDRWGAHQYCGVDSNANWPGTEDRPPLVIHADSFTLLWCTDGSNVDWGWKFTVTAEFLPEFPLGKRLNQLDARAYRLFEVLYEKMSHQRTPLKGEFDEFAKVVAAEGDIPTQDSTRQLLSTCRLGQETKWEDLENAKRMKALQFRVVNSDGVKVYREKNRESDVVGELGAGMMFTAREHQGSWLQVSSEDIADLGEEKGGWICQRSGGTIHAASAATCANGEDLLTLGIDDKNFETKDSVLEMDESNDEETSLTTMCSPFSFDEFKGQIDRIQSLAYDSHRALATKAARDAILTFLSNDPKRAPVALSALGDVEEILLLLSHFFLEENPGAAYDSQSDVLLSLGKRLKHMVACSGDDLAASLVLKRCMEMLQCGPKLLPKGRGAVRMLESMHPYHDNMDQYWDVSIPGAKRIKVVFDRRCKSEAGCDWLRFYKSGSNRTETLGPDQIGGRGDSENWPGSRDRPPLFIDDDSFEVYFHSDSSNNDWGFKFYAIGIFEEEDPSLSGGNASDSKEVLGLLSMVCWILEVVSSISNESFQGNTTAFKALYSAETLQTLISMLEDSPQCIKTHALDVLTNICRNSAFHTLPVVLIEHVRNLVNIKMRAKYQAEDRVEVKSPYLQTLVQCALAMDVAIDSRCFERIPAAISTSALQCLPLKSVTDGGLSTYISDASTPTTGIYQFQLIFRTLVSPVKFGLVHGPAPASSSAPMSMQWSDSGDLWIGDEGNTSNKDDFVKIEGYESRIREGDAVTIQLDTKQQTLVFRKNSVVVATIAGPEASGALTPWGKLNSSLRQGDDVRLIVHSNAENQIEFRKFACSPVALIPEPVVPIWYNKIVDAVGTMLDLHENGSSSILEQESRHPLSASASAVKAARISIDMNGAVALEIRFDKRTKLQKNDALRFFYANGTETTAGNDGSPRVVFSGLNGELDEKASPQLFATETAKQIGGSLSVGDKVVRSLDWEYNDEDGGAGSVGIVEEITAWGHHGGKGVRVRWPASEAENVYRYGFNGRFDVQNLQQTRLQSAPFIIKGGAFSFDFHRSSPPPTTGLDLSAAIPEFEGSAMLDGYSRLAFEFAGEKESCLLKSDCTVELWACLSKDIFAEHSESAAFVEVFRIRSPDGLNCLVFSIDQAGKCMLQAQVVDAKGSVSERRPYCDDSGVANGSSANIVLGQWMHLALVFSGLTASLFKNGDLIYSARCSAKDRLVFGSQSSLVFGRRSEAIAASPDGTGYQPSSLPFCGHLYDVRVWDIAFRPEQLRSHARGLESVDVASLSLSRPGTPSSVGGKPRSPSIGNVSSPRSPRALTIPLHMRKWVTTNRTSKDVSTVRLNCSVATSSVVEDAKLGATAYYEAHALSGGKLCVGWILDGVKIQSRATMIGEQCGSFGIEPVKKLAHLSGSSCDLTPFPAAESTGNSSPRRSFGDGVFASDIFCRNGDVVGCTLNLKTNALAFYINGQLVAECTPSIDAVNVGSTATQEGSSILLDADQGGEFEALVSEIVSPGELSRPSTATGTRFYPSAGLGPQGAQGLAWNFGQRPFKFEPTLEDGELISVLKAAGCSEEDAHFEVFDLGEDQWERVVYRHKVQEITPRLAGWWKLNEGVGNTVEDASGNNHHGLLLSRTDDIEEEKAEAPSLTPEDDSSRWWDADCSPPAVARRRTGDGNAASPFFPFSTGSDATKKPETFWGYKFYVIPHFSTETIGRRRFQSPSLRFGDSPRNVQLRHDQQLIKYVNKKALSKSLTVTQLLHAPWSDVAPQEEELARWPALVEIVTSASISKKPNKDEAKSVNGTDMSSLVLQEFNAAIYRILPFISFHAPSADDAEDVTEQLQLLLGRLLMDQRHRIFSAVKRTLWESALSRTNESTASFELTLNRPKAMRFRATGKTDVEGRHTLFSQAFRQLQGLDGAHFRRENALYHVTFLGENAQDAGGPYRETFAQYCEELQSSQLPLLLPTSNSQHNVGVGREKWLLSPGASSSTSLHMLEFLGKLVGASMRNKQYLALNLAPIVWKKLAGERVGLDDLAAVDSMLVNSMAKMRTIDRYGVTEEMFEDIVMETFTTLGADNRVVELKPDGARLPVTFSSRCEYADLVEQARLHESDGQVQAIFSGLAKVVPVKLLTCFSGSELELMVCGSPEVDVDLLEKCTEYSSCSPSDQHIVWFWNALRAFSHEERSAFLRFVWGRSRLPANADEFPQRFKLQSFGQQRAGRSVDDYMPVAHTCFFSVEMPAYTSEAVLREKLLYAIYNCQEIDGDGDSVAANQLGWEE
ncbi:hypothetical protein BBJ28_00005902 [Nothophytophthora sp. Chile5]|nr:hypothetical protein BBJ28_00005902 [Nothophytophthora sp. Chile5]